MVQASQAADPGLRELGMLLLTTICESLGDKLAPMFPQIKALLDIALKDPVSQAVRMQAVRAFGSVVCLHSHTPDALQFKELIPALMDTLERVRTSMHVLGIQAAAGCGCASSFECVILMPSSHLQCLKNFDERDARACLDVISDMAESPLHFLSAYIVVTARAMVQVPLCSVWCVLCLVLSATSHRSM